jgi:uncharacterized RDD family membrane protein YckC
MMTVINLFINLCSPNKTLGNEADKERGYTSIMEKVECTNCEVMILETTFEKNDGRCMPCEKIKNEAESTKYAGFWERMGSYFLDVLALIPLTLFIFWGNEQSRLFQIYYFIPGLLFSFWFHVYLVKRYGGTPGKLLLKIKISKLDGSNVNYKEAVLRYLVLFILGFIISMPIIMATLDMTDAEYYSYDWRQRASAFTQMNPVWYSFTITAMNIWIWSEFIIMLTNKKRRAIHDFMAGTVVIKNDMSNKPIKLT